MEIFKQDQLQNLPVLVQSEPGGPQAGTGKPVPPSQGSVPQPAVDRPLRWGIVPGSSMAKSLHRGPCEPGVELCWLCSHSCEAGLEAFGDFLVTHFSLTLDVLL